MSKLKYNMSGFLHVDLIDYFSGWWGEPRTTPRHLSVLVDLEVPLGPSLGMLAMLNILQVLQALKITLMY